MWQVGYQFSSPRSLSAEGDYGDAVVLGGVLEDIKPTAVTWGHS